MNKNITEKIVISLYVISHTIIMIYMLWTRVYAGEFYGRGHAVKIPYSTLLLLYLVTVIGYLFIYFIYKNIKKVNLSIKSKLNIHRFHYFFMFLLLMQIAFYIITGVGRVGGNNSSRFSSVFAMLNVDCIFGIYYFSCRGKNKKYIFNIVLYILYQLIKGWSGIILTVAIYEIYFLIESDFFKRIRYKTLIWLYFVPVFAIGGGLGYYLFYPLKQYVRYGYYETISLGEGIIKLINRLSYYPVAAIALQNYEKIKTIYLAQNIEFLDIKAMLRPVMPRFLMPIKEFRSLNNIVINSVYPDLGMGTSANFGLWTYGLMLFEVNILEFFSWIVIALVLLIGIIAIFKFLEQKSGQYNILIFLFLINFIQTASLEISFSYYYLYLLYMIPIMFLAGVFRIVKRSR